MLGGEDPLDPPGPEEPPVVAVGAVEGRRLELAAAAVGQAAGADPGAQRLAGDRPRSAACGAADERDIAREQQLLGAEAARLGLFFGGALGRAGLDQPGLGEALHRLEQDLGDAAVAGLQSQRAGGPVAVPGQPRGRGQERLKELVLAAVEGEEREAGAGAEAGDPRVFPPRQEEAVALLDVLDQQPVVDRPARAQALDHPGEEVAELGDRALAARHRHRSVLL